MAYVLTNLRIRKDVVRQISKKVCLRRTYDKQHGKRSQIVLKYAQLIFYQIY